MGVGDPPFARLRSNHTQHRPLSTWRLQLGLLTICEHRGRLGSIQYLIPVSDAHTQVYESVMTGTDDLTQECEPTSSLALPAEGSTSETSTTVSR